MYITNTTLWFGTQSFMLVATRQSSFTNGKLECNGFLQ